MKKLANKLINKRKIYLRKKHRVNTTVKTVSDLPRLIVNRSNKFIYAQIIDLDGKVVAKATDMKVTGWTKSEKAKNVGIELAKLAIEKKVTKVVFDRNGYIYHGRIKQLAEGAREGWLQF